MQINEDLKKIEEEIEKEVSSFGAEVGKVETEPLAFGLNILKVFVIMNEKKGDTEPLEDKIKSVKGVESVEEVSPSRQVLHLGTNVDVDSVMNEVLQTLIVQNCRVRSLRLLMTSLEDAYLSYVGGDNE